jgi:hypothetical protein
MTKFKNNHSASRGGLILLFEMSQISRTERMNPLTGVIVKLTPKAVKLHDTIKQQEINGELEFNLLNKFARQWPKEFYALLA